MEILPRSSASWPTIDGLLSARWYPSNAPVAVPIAQNGYKLKLTTAPPQPVTEIAAPRQGWFFAQLLPFTLPRSHAVLSPMERHIRTALRPLQGWRRTGSQRPDSISRSCVWIELYIANNVADCCPACDVQAGFQSDTHERISCDPATF